MEREPEIEARICENEEAAALRCGLFILPEAVLENEQSAGDDNQQNK